MVMYDKEFEKMGNEIRTKNKIEPQYTHQMLKILRLKGLKIQRISRGRGGGMFSQLESPCKVF